jgi:glycosyltransferase involved in cell wall biosynthesis
VPAHKIRVVPSGVDLRRFAPNARAAFDGARPLRVLFVGRVSIMKGVPYLLQALNKLGPKLVQARFVGGVHLNREKLIASSNVGNFTGHIPRHSLPEEYRWADVFCFPSLTEGSADVTYEALASGLPVVTTPNSGSIVYDGVDGFIVPIRDPDALAETIGRYAADRELLAQHQAATLQRRERAGLDRYKGDLVSVIREISTSVDRPCA